MSDRLRRARMSLAQAITRSAAAPAPDTDAGRAAAESALAADLRLRRGGREDLGDRVAQVLGDDDDVTSAAARRELRQVAQLVDAELEPSVSTGSFRAASDGGVR